jgi:flagellum-specific peptidoglycan hydrolase FlgJ
MANIDQDIYNMAIAEGFSPISAKLIVAQARLESGDYSSNVFVNNNNMFGMKYVGQTLEVH